MTVPLVDVLTEESLRTLGAERDGLLSAYGREPAPRGASANDPERVLPQQASDCLDLQLAFVATSTLRKYRQNQFRPRDHSAIQRLLKIALLTWR